MIYFGADFRLELQIKLLRRLVMDEDHFTTLHLNCFTVILLHKHLNTVTINTFVISVQRLQATSGGSPIINVTFYNRRSIKLISKINKHAHEIKKIQHQFRLFTPKAHFVFSSSFILAVNSPVPP